MTAPEQIGRYRIERELGRGGMGVVYAAYDDQLERSVAIKMIAGAAADEKARKRLRREARAAGRIQHPNVCHLYEIGDDDGELFLAMELLEGEALSDRLRRGAMPVLETVAIAKQLLSALEALHAKGLVHRDLKPSNLFLTQHGIKILDFGLAQTVQTDVLLSQDSTETQLTEVGTVVGTPPYMAPEQFQGKATDARTDLFAVGALIFEMVTGSRAFPGESALQVYHKTLHEQPPALGGSDAATALDRVVRRALAKKPEDRFSNAGEMAAALGTVAEVEETGEVRALTVSRLMVMPFRILRSDPDTDFLGVGISDAVTNALIGVESLIVRSSAVAARFAGEELDLERIATEAGVDVLITGSLLRADDQIRVTTQMVEVPSGVVLWSQAPTVAMRDVFELQDRIVKHIVESLSLSLTAREHKQVQTDVPASPTAYEFFLRGNQLVLRQGTSRTEDLAVARDLYQHAVEEDPRFAPAWVRLGRCHWLIGKSGENPADNRLLAEKYFQRALELNPELELAHNYYALLELDQGQAQEAMVRLIERAVAGSHQPELFVALVQACRYCGLLEASAAAHERAEQLDRTVVTSVAATYAWLRDVEKCLAYTQRRFHGEIPISHRHIYAQVVGIEGDVARAVELLRELEDERLSDLYRAVIVWTRAQFEDKREESLEAATRVVAELQDAEGIAAAARAFAYFEDFEGAKNAFRRSFDKGYNPYRFLTNDDPHLAAFRLSPDFEEILPSFEARYHESLEAFRQAGGEQLLGPCP